MVEYDPEEAGRILDEAGWVMGADGVRERNGQKLTLNQISTDFENWGLFNQIIQEQLQAIGINCEIWTLEWNAYLDQWRENQGGWNATYHQQGTQVAATEAIEAGGRRMTTGRSPRSTTRPIPIWWPFATGCRRSGTSGR